jgi:hypothetical protein
MIRCATSPPFSQGRAKRLTKEWHQVSLWQNGSFVFKRAHSGKVLIAILQTARLLDDDFGRLEHRSDCLEFLAPGSHLISLSARFCGRKAIHLLTTDLHALTLRTPVPGGQYRNKIV